MVNIIIRKEEPTDYETVAKLTENAFKDVEYSNHTEHFIINALRNANRLTVSLVAEKDDVIIGHVAISPVSISGGAENWYGLGPVSVRLDCQRQGIGSKLVQHALGHLKKIKAAGCVVLGDPEYYARFGFKQIAGLTFPGVPAEYFQALIFSDKAFPQGEVTYHPAFYATM